MPDDRTNRSPQDAARIDVHEAYEVRHWTQELGVTEEILRAAVPQVGPSVEKVREYLGSHV